LDKELQDNPTIPTEPASEPYTVRKLIHVVPLVRHARSSLHLVPIQ